MGEFGVWDMEAAKNSGNGAVGLGMKVQRQNLEAFPSKSVMMMMVCPPHDHHHDPLLYGPSFAAAGDGDGPTTCKSPTNYTNHFVNAAAASSVSGAALVRPLQPFHVSASTTFKSSAGGLMAASLGFPFTKAQWKELERQAMIYKYMMASIPVPPHLLIPVPASRSPSADIGFNLRFTSSSDAEPGRCRRTDGKKWRCSRDVAPNHKYCERHMHRGRPRSRKHVEIQATSNKDQQINRTSQDYPSLSTPTMTISNSPIRKSGSSSPFLASTTTCQPYFEPSLSLDKLGVKAANFDSLASVPRGVDWMLKGDPNPMDPQWHHLIQNKLGLNTGSSCNDDASNSITRPKGLLPLFENSNDVFSSKRDQRNKRPMLYLNPIAVPIENPRSIRPRASIDAWSSAEMNANKRSSVASNKLLLSSLDLQVGGSVDEDMGAVRMALGQMDPQANWAPCLTPGGPLGEVLRPSKVATTTGESPAATMASSPSGVLPKTLASFSDSSSSSSPRPRVGSSRATSDMASLCFNHANLPS